MISDAFTVFPDLSTSRHQFPMLHKPKLDNVKQYLETKQQRIDEIKKQRENKSVTPSGDRTQQLKNDMRDILATSDESVEETPGRKKQKVVEA